MGYQYDEESDEGGGWGGLIAVASVVGNLVQASDKAALKKSLEAEKKSLEAARTENSTLRQAKTDLEQEVQQLRWKNQRLTGDLQAARDQASQFQKELEREKSAHAETKKKTQAELAKLRGDLDQEKTAHAQS